MSPSRRAVLLLAFVAASLALYSGGLWGGYYADDFQFVFDRSTIDSPWAFFVSNIRENGFYRPLQAFFLWHVQSAFGLNTLPVHLAQVLLHGATAWLLYLFVRANRFSALQAGLAAVLMLVAQANVHAVESNDTVSQVGSALFGYLAVWIYWRRGASPAGVAAACACLLAALLFKENGVSFFLMICGLAALRFRSEKSARARIAAGLVPFVVLVAVYLTVRSHTVSMQPTIGDTTYTFRFGFNVLVNTGMLVFSSLSPVSNVALFVAAKSRDFAVLAAAAALAGTLSLAALAGLFKSRERAGFLLGLCAVLLLSFLPVVLLARVSELYAYNSTPPLFALMGIGLGALARGRFARIAAGALVAVAIGAHVVATRSKVDLMVANGERAAALYAQIAPLAAGTPPGGELVLLNPPRSQVEYSLFLMRDFNVLEHGAHRAAQLAGRDDFKVRIADEAPPPGPSTRVLTLDPGTGAVSAL
jgi:hypothetical protein